MPWQLDGFVAERLEKCRQLLEAAEAAGGQGDAEGQQAQQADMRVWVEYADLIVALHRTALDERGRGRSALSPGERVQLCVLFVLAISKHPLVSLGVEPAADPVLSLATRLLPADSAWEPLRLAVFVCGNSGMGYAAEQTAVASLLRWLERHPDAAEQLPELQRQAGSAYSVTAQQLKEVALYRSVKASLKGCDAAQTAGRPMPALLLADAADAVRQLVAAAPAWPRYLLLQSEVDVARGDGPGFAASNRCALEAATAKNAHYWKAQAALNISLGIMGGAEGQERFSVGEARRLLDQSEEEYRLSRSWVAPSVYKTCVGQVREYRAALEDEVAAAAAAASSAGGRRRGSGSARAAMDQLPVFLDLGWSGIPAPKGRTCSGCGGLAVELKKCSGCRVAEYCGRECQLAHWKQGGHKHECAALAAR